MKREFFIFVSVFFITCFQGCADSTDEYAVYEDKRKKYTNSANNCLLR